MFCCWYQRVFLIYFFKELYCNWKKTTEIKLMGVVGICRVYWQLFYCLNGDSTLICQLLPNYALVTSSSEKPLKNPFRSQFDWWLRPQLKSQKAVCLHWATARECMEVLTASQGGTSSWIVWEAAGGRQPRAGVLTDSIEDAFALLLVWDA